MTNQQLTDALDRVSGLLRHARDKDGQTLRLHAVVASNRNGAEVLDLSNGSQRVDLRSVSKPVLALLLGGLEGLDSGAALAPDALVWPLFADEVDLSNHGNLDALRALRVSHLLNSTMGHHDGIMFRKDIGDRDEASLLSYVFNAPIEHSPGTHFVYSNAGAFIISAMITRLFRRRADELAAERLFGRLGIDNVNWRRFGADCSGCTGLELNALEINRLGRVIQDGGRSASECLAPAAWCQQMLDSTYPTPTMTDEKRAMPKRGYGHFLWKSRNGHSYTDGTDGQYLILCGDGETVITVTGEQPDMKQIGEALRPLLDIATGPLIEA